VSLQVIEGVCKLLDEYGIILPTTLVDGEPGHENSQSDSGAPMKSRILIFGPALVHDPNPNLLLAESSGEIRAVATRPIAKGEALCCDYRGHCRLPERVYSSLPDSSGDTGAKRGLHIATQGLIALIKMEDSPRAWPTADKRWQLNTIIRHAGADSWVAYAARLMLLRDGIDCEAHARAVYDWMVVQLQVAPPCATAYIAGHLFAGTPLSPDDVCVGYLREASRS
jgi:hypothetical protein